MPDSPAEGNSDCQIEETNQSVTEEDPAREVARSSCRCDGEAALLIPPNESAAQQQYSEVENQTPDQEYTHQADLLNYRICN
jgi:hypothetical protein